MLKIQNKVVTTPIIEILYQLRSKTNAQYLKDIKESNDDIMITCPFHGNHQENHPSCGVIGNSSLDNTGVFHCFACGRSGTFDEIVADESSMRPLITKYYFRI